MYVWYGIIVDFQALDTNLPLSGLNSVVGRSIVIHKSTGSRWKCLNTVWEAEAMNGTLYEAVAQFFGDIEGEILFVSKFSYMYLFNYNSFSVSAIYIQAPTIITDIAS